MLEFKLSRARCLNYSQATETRVLLSFFFFSTFLQEPLLVPYFDVVENIHLPSIFDKVFYSFESVYQYAFTKEGTLNCSAFSLPHPNSLWQGTLQEPFVEGKELGILIEPG